MTDEPTIGGRAILISLITPEGDVNVEQPVKFKARNAETEGSNSRYPTARSQSSGESHPHIHTANIVQHSPNSQPFKEKALTGINGSSTGVRTDPIMTAPL